MTHYEKMRENYEDAVFYLLMDQLAGKQEEEYNRINEELKMIQHLKCQPKCGKRVIGRLRKNFQRPIEQQQNGLLGKHSSAYPF